MASVKKLLKQMATIACGNYELIRIYYIDISDANIKVPCDLEFRRVNTVEEIYQSGTTDIRTRDWYAGPNGYGFGILENCKLVCMCWYWTKQHPKLPKRFSQIKDDDAVRS